MPPINLDTAYDALIVVLDEREELSSEEDSFFRRELSMILEAKKFIYYKNNPMNAEELFMDIVKRTRSHEAMLPASKRMVLCNYVDASQLSEEWLRRYRERMETFMTMAPVKDGFQQYHVTFIRYQAFHKIGEKQEEVSAVLQKLWDTEERLPMEHTEFLFYEGGLDNLDSHEKGAVRLLQLLSMKDYWRVYDRNGFGKALYLLAYEDYYAARAQICKNEIEAITKWMETSKDPELVNFELEAKNVLTSGLYRYEEEMRKFRQHRGLYPVSIQEYTAHGFGPFKTFTRNTGKHPELEKEKVKYQKSFLDGLESSDEKEQFLGKLQENMNYPDFRAYISEMESGGLQSRIRRVLESGFEKADREEKEMFEQLLNRWMEEFLNEKGKELETEKRRRENIRTQKEFESLQANHFDTLALCFETIRKELSYQAPAQIVPVTVAEIALVNSEVGSNWMEQNYHIEGIEDEKAAILPAIAPSEIQYLKFGKYIELDDGENTKQKLRDILR